MKKLILGLCFFATDFAILAPYAHAVFIHKPVRTIEQSAPSLPQQGSEPSALKAPPLSKKVTLKAPPLSTAPVA